MAFKADKESKILHSMKQEIDLLNMVITYKCDEKDSEEDRAVVSSLGGEVEGMEAANPGVKKRKGKMSALSGDV